ncbi:MULTISPECIES: hypothetical protein [Kitasatospora]|uniref:Secreted protein n=1 Tax=Kitasatospora cystarginea TaxID=58350 RepID=A0ABP5RKM4_9ACTN
MSVSIKWAALAQTAGVSFAVTIAVVAVFSVGVLALCRREAALETAGTGGATAGKGSLALASVCFTACAGAVLYGLSLIAG